MRALQHARLPHPSSDLCCIIPGETDRRLGMHPASQPHATKQCCSACKGWAVRQHAAHLLPLLHIHHHVVKDAAARGQQGGSVARVCSREGQGATQAVSLGVRVAARNAAVAGPHTARARAASLSLALSGLRRARQGPAPRTHRCARDVCRCRGRRAESRRRARRCRGASGCPAAESRRTCGARGGGAVQEY